MKVDLPNYLNTYASNEVMRSIAEIVAYNNWCSIKIPYGQGRFDGMLSDKTTEAELVQIKAKVKKQVFNFWNTNGKIPTRRYPIHKQ
jgi:amidase